MGKQEQKIPTKLLTGLRDLGLPQDGEGKYVLCTPSGVGQRQVYHPTFEELLDFVSENLTELWVNNKRVIFEPVILLGGGNCGMQKIVTVLYSDYQVMGGGANHTEALAQAAFQVAANKKYSD